MRFQRGTALRRPRVARLSQNQHEDSQIRVSGGGSRRILNLRDPGFIVDLELVVAA